MSEITSELEAVAVAIYEADPKSRMPPVNSYPWQSQNDTTRDVYRLIACAALKALREPSEGMLDAAQDRDMDVFRYQAESSFIAMIDHALGVSHE